MDRVIGAESVPPPAKVNSLQAITKLKPAKHSDWCVFAYVLNRDVLLPDGKLDDLRAVAFPLGAFSEREKAEAHCKSVMRSLDTPL